MAAKAIGLGDGATQADVEAAVLSGKSRSEFMLEAARRAATDAILDRTLLRLEPAAFTRFLAMLDAPPQPNEKLRKLLKTTPPWG
jgi:uncharacterized protein (DUF1778 family)